VGIFPSASKTRLLFGCPRPFDSDMPVEEDVGDAARYGSAFHQIIAKCLRPIRGAKVFERTARYAKEVDLAAERFDVRHAADELAGHVKSSVGFLRKWLAREELEVVEIETAHAVVSDVNGGFKARPIAGHDEEHRYAVRSGEMPGTLDVLARSKNRKRLVVVDHKTGAGEYEGENFALPAQVKQLRTLGLAAAYENSGVRGGMKDLELGIFHADRRGLPIVYSEPYEPVAQRAHAAELNAAMARIGGGFFRPGDYCRYCPARFQCPARISSVLNESSEALARVAIQLAAEPIDGPLAPPTEASIEERAGALYDLLRKFRELDEYGMTEIKRLVRSGAVIETRQGVLGLRTDRFETLSKRSILDALGGVDGAKELKRLRKKGAIRESTREVFTYDK
jgi:hypothetical protein